MRYKTMDLKPYIFKTSDYGETWTKITNGITDPHTFVRVVREDPKRKGLLYAGTETGLYISLNDGMNWQPFQLNLPVVPINDMIFQDNDLVVATAGRSFWILDDVGAIQSAPVTNTSVAIIQPKNTYLLFGGSTDKPVPGLGQNPKQGVTVDYYLGQKLDSVELTLEVLQNNEVIRTYSSKKPKDFSSWPGGPSKPEVLPAKKGYNRFTWDFRKDDLPSVDKVFVYGSYAGSRVAPGAYALRLTLGENVSETTVNVLPNPKVEATTADYAEQQKVLDQIASAITSIHEAVNQMRSAKNQLYAYEKLLKDNEEAKDLVDKGKELLERINSWEENLIQPKQKTFQDVINFHNQLNAEFMNLRDYVDAAEPKVTQGARERLADLLGQWSIFEQEKNAIVATEMNAYNALYKSLNLPAIIIEK
jgi:predicted nuclease with TOPRIM domain